MPPVVQVNNEILHEIFQCVAFPFVQDMSYAAGKDWFTAVDHCNHTLVKRRKDPVDCIMTALRQNPKLKQLNLLHNNVKKPLTSMVFCYHPLIFDNRSRGDLREHWLSKVSTHTIKITFTSASLHLPDVVKSLINHQAYILYALEWVQHMTHKVTNTGLKDLDMVTAVESYKGSYYNTLNQYLRCNILAEDESLQYVKYIDKELMRLVSLSKWQDMTRQGQTIRECMPHGVQLFRTLRGKVAQDIVNGKTKVLMNKGYSSFALDPQHSMDLLSPSDKSSVLLVCSVQEGTPFAFIDGFRCKGKLIQSEVLFGKWLSIRIKNILPYSVPCMRNGSRLVLHVAFGHAWANKKTPE